MILPTVKLHLQETNCKYSFPVQALKVVFHAASVLARISVFAFVHVFKHLSAYSPIKIWIHMLNTDKLTSETLACFFSFFIGHEGILRMVRVNSSFIIAQHCFSILKTRAQNNFFEITPSLKVTLKTVHLES